jgi:hypothetical protein
MNNHGIATLAPIQMLWVRGDLTRLELLSVRSFLANGHPVHLYTYEPPRNVPAAVEIRDAAAIVPRERVPTIDRGPFSVGSLASFSDYFRYSLLDECGGWWADADIVCIRPWQFSAPALTASTLEPPYGRIANNCVMRFPARHPVLHRCREHCERLDLDRVGITETGPCLLNANLLEFGATTLPVASDVFCPVPWNASWQVVRPRWMRFTWDEFKQRVRRPHLSCRFTRRTVAVHLWNETWRDSGRDKSARYAPSCLYERLQQRWNPS